MSQELQPIESALETEVVDARDLRIKILEKMLEDREGIIRDQDECRRATRYFLDHMFLFARSAIGDDTLMLTRLLIAHKRVLEAMTGDLKMPRIEVDHGHV